MNNNHSLKWLKKESRIVIDKEYEDKILDTDNAVIGIYGLFVEDDVKEKCVYIGRSANIYSRLFRTGHITELMKNTHTNNALTVAMEENRKITIKVLEEVVFSYDNYAKDMQKLAFAEYKLISRYQAVDECIEQLPDGSNMDKDSWEKLKNLNDGAS